MPLPDDPPTSNTRIIGKISVIEGSLAALMKLVKGGLTLQREFLLPTQASQALKSATEKSSKPTFAALAASPSHPSMVVSFHGVNWIDHQKPQPADICSSVNTGVAASHSTHISSLQGGPTAL